MLGRIDPVVPASQHSERAAIEACAVRGLIDATRQSGGNDKTGVAQIMRQLACEFQAGTGRVA